MNRRDQVVKWTTKIRNGMHDISKEELDIPSDSKFKEFLEYVIGSNIYTYKPLYIKQEGVDILLSVSLKEMLGIGKPLIMLDYSTEDLVEALEAEDADSPNWPKVVNFLRNVSKLPDNDKN